VLAYRACADAIPELAAIARDVRDVDFQDADSLYYASKRGHRDDLYAEYVLRARHGFPVEWLEEQPLHERFGIEAPGAILSSLAAYLDPYRMAHRLLARLARRRTRVYTRTALERIEPTARGVTLHTSRDSQVRAKHVVLAAGYAGMQWLDRKVARNRSSYAMISEPIADAALGPLARTMVWESARPYLYLRTTGEGRLLIGGEDDSVDVPARRDARVMKRARTLLAKLGELFPRLPVEFAFAWGGTFAETADGLPFFGPSDQHGPRVHFAMAYGGNGITYSMIGARLLRAGIERRAHPLAELFSFRRLDRA
jgi:glycine/D-amino acid oxidase-like deaminating enzyme